MLGIVLFFFCKYGCVHVVIDMSASCSNCTSLTIADDPFPILVVLQIFYLNQDKQPLLRKHIDGLPTLYLDCNEDIDMHRDQAAKDSLAKQINDFSNHVRSLHKARYGMDPTHICLLLTVSHL